MKELDPLDRLDLSKHGDRHEREFWPLLSEKFPSYEVLWRRVVVPMTFRVDQKAAMENPKKWIRLRPGLPVKYEEMAMAHYSVFYFLGRAMKRVTEDLKVYEHPDDVFFLLHTVSDNFKWFMKAMNSIGSDNGCNIFDRSMVASFPKGFAPFEEIRDYRDVLLHNPVIGRASDLDNIYLPKWDAEKSKSPLERAKQLWSRAETLSASELVSSKDLLSRILGEACGFLEKEWQGVLSKVGHLTFEEKLVTVLRLKEFFPLPEEWGTPAGSPGASGYFTVLSSNTFEAPVRGEQKKSS